MLYKRRKKRKRNIVNRLALCRDILQKNPKIDLKELAALCYGKNFSRREYECTAALRAIAQQQLFGKQKQRKGGPYRPRSLRSRIIR
jgi:hypothetical protein